MPTSLEESMLDRLKTMGYRGAEGNLPRTRRFAIDASVGRPEAQAFVGALHGNQANQGVFITTGRFASGARAYVDSVPTR